MLTANGGWEAQAIQLLRLHLTIVIPFTVLILRILIRVFSREDYKDILRGLGSWPLDLMVIAMSFMLTALAGFSRSYVSKFKSQHDADLWAVASIACIFLLSVAVNRLLKWNQILAGKLYVAFQQIQRIQPGAGQKTPSIEVVGRILWAMVYCIVMALVLVCCFGIAVPTLAYVLHLIQ